MKFLRILAFLLQSYALGLLFCVILGFLLNHSNTQILHSSFVAFPLFIVAYFVLRFGQNP